MGSFRHRCDRNRNGCWSAESVTSAVPGRVKFNVKSCRFIFLWFSFLLFLLAFVIFGLESLTTGRFYTIQMLLSFQMNACSSSILAGRPVFSMAARGSTIHLEHLLESTKWAMGRHVFFFLSFYSPSIIFKGVLGFQFLVRINANFVTAYFRFEWRNGEKKSKVN